MINKLNIVFISASQYPEGGAESNRHLAYAKGLAELGNKVTFLLTSPQKFIGDKIFLSGIQFIGIGSQSNQNTRKINFIKKLFSVIKAVNKCSLNLKTVHKIEKIDVLILLETKTWKLFPLIKLAKHFNITTIHERTEYPFVLNNEYVLKKLDFYLFYKFLLPRIDGLFVITQALKKYFINDIKFKRPIAIINMMVDPIRFNFTTNCDHIDQPYIAYCGTMEGDKDGVDILIRAFGKAINQYPDCAGLKMKLIGDVSSEDLIKKLKKIAFDANCLDDIIFTGKIERDKIPSLLLNAKALALARPSNKQAEGGFPTKLGEYLATGKPVIMTRVGEIENFLIDGNNSFLALPNDVDSFAAQIGNVFKDYNKAIQIGEEGRKLIFNVFNYNVQAKLLNQYIKETIITKGFVA